MFTLSRSFAAAAIIALSAVSAQAGTTCSIDQRGKVTATSWLANAPKNFSEIVRNKLTLAAYAAFSDGPIQISELPSALITCFGDDGAPSLIQEIRVVAKDRKSGKECAAVRRPFGRGDAVIPSTCDADFDTIIVLP